ncbi:hypothetical protein C5Y96_05835 [Blastopirellula marina]|uniref:Uncharacterized protein n=1 Tax=Blastopirellula marina TaxID=124 RepID=A0A2S8G5E6_9BACT|nr:hypothetical protein C5Y96_05835 [Blastopirellula marina]RCS55682.1 hypothetical protein DTL36_05845 [Bremerella cremea]
MLAGAYGGANRLCRADAFDATENSDIGRPGRSGNAGFRGPDVGLYCLRWHAAKQQGRPVFPLLDQTKHDQTKHDHAEYSAADCGGYRVGLRIVRPGTEAAANQAGTSWPAFPFLIQEPKIMCAMRRTLNVDHLVSLVSGGVVDLDGVLINLADIGHGLIRRAVMAATRPDKPPVEALAVSSIDGRHFLPGAKVLGYINRHPFDQFDAIHAVVQVTDGVTLAWNGTAYRKLPDNWHDFVELRKAA